jgi:hypothetical protein
MQRKIDGVIDSPMKPVIGQRLWACSLLDSKDRFEYGSTIHLTAITSIEGPDKHGITFIETKNSRYMVIPNATAAGFPSL